MVPEAKAALTRALGTIESDARAAGRKTTRAAGDPVVFHRGPSTGNQVQPADGRVFPRSERIRLEMEADTGAPGWTGALLDRNGTKTVVPVVTGRAHGRRDRPALADRRHHARAARSRRLRRRAVDREGQRDAEVARRDPGHPVTVSAR